MPPSAIDREDYTHPEKIHEDLIYASDAAPVPEEARKARRHKDAKRVFWNDDADPKEEELCWSCGWNVYHELVSPYGSPLRIFHTGGNIGIWEVGSRWLIRDQPNDASLGNDFITQEFLRNQPHFDIPLMKEMRKLSALTDNVDLTLMSRAQGVGLNTIWYTLSAKQETNYANQLGDAVKQLRQFTSPVPRKVDDALPNDCLIGHCLRRTSTYSQAKDPAFIEDKCQEIKRNFPKPEPYVLTYGDLNLTNIIVKDEKVEAIIDREYSAYLSWWAER